MSPWAWILTSVWQVASAGVVDVVDPAAVETVASTPFVRHYRIHGADVVLRKSPGPDELSDQPTCRGGGVDLVVEGAVPPALQALLPTLCARLETQAPQLYSEVRGPLPARPTVVGTASLRVLSMLWLLATLWIVPRRAAPWLWALGAAGVRWVLAPPHVLMSVAYPYARMLTYAGVKEPSVRYGMGWSALLDVLRPLFGSSPEALLTANLALSSLAVALAWTVAWRWTRDVAIAHLAAAGLALLPLAVTLAGTETMFVAASAVLLAGATGVVRGGGTGHVVLALSASLLPHLRPLQSAPALVLALVLLGRRSWWALLPLASLGWRVWQLVQVPGDAPWPDATDAARVVTELVGSGSPTVVLDPWVTPAVLVIAAGLGAAERWRADRRTALALCMVLGAAFLPYLAFHRATDLLRMHLPAAGLWVLFAAASLPWLRRRAPLARGVGLAFVVASWVVARAPLEGGTAQQAEHAALRDSLCAEPAHSEGVWYDPGLDPQGVLPRWLEAVCGTTLRRVGQGGPSGGALVWLGRARALEGAWSPPCAFEPLWEREVPSNTGRVEALGTEPLRVGLYRLSSSCGESAKK